MLPLVLADLVNGDDVGVVETGRRLGLGAEALHLGWRGQLAGEDHLEGDFPFEADLPGPIHDAHAASRDLLQQLVVAEVLSPRWDGIDRRRLARGEVARKLRRLRGIWQLLAWGRELAG